ncbi:TniQ family protein [Streptomyces sp. NPDC058545]|uniref:TniQ family protein n=1 Tax=Streptomyces sp. NPDC058545 TaxID=3346544 RepID=UPI0036476333
MGLSALRVDLSPVGGETTGSFIGRLAEANVVPVGQVLDLLGAGSVREPDWRACEVFLSEQALRGLAVLAGRDVECLRRALPTVADRGPERSEGRPVRIATWSVGWQVLVECAGCAARRSDGLRPAWLAGGAAWEVCVRHGRWLEGADASSHVSLAAVADVVCAHKAWLGLRRRVGPYARALLADAGQVVWYWWRGRQMGSETVWAGRERALGWERRPAGVPLVTYPEVVRVAECMAVHERQRRWGREFDNGAPGWVSRRWITWVGERLGLAAEMEQAGYRALRAWTMKHCITTPVADRLRQPPPPRGYRRGPLPVMDPHRALPERGPLLEASCLPWRP